VRCGASNPTEDLEGPHKIPHTPVSAVMGSLASKVDKDPKSLDIFLVEAGGFEPATTRIPSVAKGGGHTLVR